ncbi:MAG: hypothetical protein JHC95_11185 [Solirubrobacteraceae bacterium]|nr:hypothetical protein [Solirubrobacteraceae bacterium]
MSTAAEPADLIDRLIRGSGLFDVAESACREGGIAGREQAVAYCLAVLVLKDDPVRKGKRHYRLDVGADDFSERLAFWAAEVARNIRAWGDTHQAIQDEADRYEIDTLRRLVPGSRADDLIDEAASRLMVVLAGGPRADEMAPDLLRRRLPPGDAYAFQTPLDRWIRTGSRRIMALRDTDPLDDRIVAEDAVGQGDFAAVVDAIAEQAEDVLEVQLAHVGRMAETRELLRGVIDRADGWEAQLAVRHAASPDESRLFVRLRAALLYVADRLRREQAAVTGMLAFLLLAMRTAVVQQHVAVLSLRRRVLDAAVVQELRDRMRVIVADTRHPSPGLVRQTQKVADGKAVPVSRLTALQELQVRPGERDRLLAPVCAMLDRLPGVVDDNEAIAVLAARAASSPVKVKSHRSKARDELSRVDPLYGAVFRRYAMDRP